MQTAQLLQDAMRAFRQLETCRQMGMSAGFIPYPEIVRWSEINGLDDGARDVLIDAVTYADALELKRQHAAAKAKPRRGR